MRSRNVLEIDLRIEPMILAEPSKEYMASSAFSASIGSGEEDVVAAEGDDAQRAFDGVVVDLECAVIE